MLFFLLFYLVFLNFTNFSMRKYVYQFSHPRKGINPHINPYKRSFVIKIFISNFTRSNVGKLNLKNV